MFNGANSKIDAAKLNEAYVKRGTAWQTTLLYSALNI